MLSVFLRNFQARKSFCRMLVLLLLWIGFGAWPPLSASEGDTLALPYVWNFSSLESFENEWTVLNANGDAQTWAWADWVQGPDGRMGGVFSSVFAGRNDDWLISKPLVFGEGLHHLSCYLKASYPPTGEVVLKVYHGADSDTAQMRLIGVLGTESTDWREKVLEFEVDAAGSYRLAFHDCSSAESVLQLDCVALGQGKAEKSPSVRIQRLLLPLSNCVLSPDAKVGLRLTNVGTAPADSLCLSYAVNGGAEVVESWQGILDVDSVMDFYFAQNADFSLPQTYEVAMKVESAFGSDSSTGGVSYKDPVGEFPFVTDFALNREVEGQWFQQNPGTWSFNRYVAAYESTAKGLENALVSRCLSMSGSYRVMLSYGGGGISGTRPAFALLFGLAGTACDSWDTLYHDFMAMSDSTVELRLEDLPAGEYSFAFENMDAVSSVKLHRMEVSVRQQYDVEILQVVAPLSAYMPIEQARGSKEYYVAVANSGRLPVEGIGLGLRDMDSVLFWGRQAVRLDTGEVRWLEMEAGMPVMNVGEIHDLKFFVQVSGDTGSMADVYEWGRLTVTDTVFATESLPVLEHGIGETGRPCRMGNVFDLTARDTLTSLSVGFVEAAGGTLGSPAVVSVYRLKETSCPDSVLGSIGRYSEIDYPVVSLSISRPEGGDFLCLPLDALVLEAGRYYVEVAQLSGFNIGLAYRQQDAAVCWLREHEGDSVLTAVQGVALAVRANLGHSAEIHAGDVAVEALASPLNDTSLFSDAEPVMAWVRNRTCETVEAKVVCRVDGVCRDRWVVLRPSERLLVDFGRFDLSRPGNHEVEILIESKGDDFQGNNQLRRMLFRWEDPDPYVLDFEKCGDFDTAVFHGQWRSFDRLGLPTTAWMWFDYPGSEESVGFIAFNPEATTPPMTEGNKVDGLFPYEGKRFGLAFAPVVDEDASRADTWLVSPRLSLGAAPEFSLYAKTYALEGMNELEPFALYVSETDAALESFHLLGNEYRAPEEWTLFCADLQDYAGRDVYVAVRYTGDPRTNVCLMVDNLQVVPDKLGLEEGDAASGGQVSLVRQGKSLLLVSNALLKDVQVFDMRGVLVFSLSDLSGTWIEMPMEDWADGLYLFRVRLCNGKEVCLKFVKAGR